MTDREYREELGIQSVTSDQDGQLQWVFKNCFEHAKANDHLYFFGFN